MKRRAQTRFGQGACLPLRGGSSATADRIPGGSRASPPKGKGARERGGPCCPSAYTLIELLTVLMIVSLLIALVVGLGRHADHVGKRRRALADIGTLHDALEQFYLQYGRYPEIPDADHAATNLAVLTNPWLGEDKADAFDRLLPPESSYLDPWRQPYQYLYDTNRPDTVDVYSLGPDRKSENDDVRYQP